MESAATIEIFEYWNELRGARPAPLRSELDPARLRHLLPDLFIVSDIGAPAPVFRLTGTHLYSLLGRELKGEPFSLLWTPDTADYCNRVARGVMQHELPVLLNLSAVTRDGYHSANFEMLLLPLQTDEFTVPRLLGAVIADRKTVQFTSPIDVFELQRTRLLRREAARTISLRAAADRNPVRNFTAWTRYGLS